MLQFYQIPCRGPARAPWLLCIAGLLGPAVVVITSVGAVTGVGIWFVTGILAPEGIGSLIHLFFWPWFIEWGAFTSEVILLLFYYYLWDRLAEKHPGRLTALGWGYVTMAVISAILISGILGFMLTPAGWPWGQTFDQAYYNPTFAPQVFLRLAGGLAIGSLLLAAWFTDLRLKLKGQTFFKTVIYMPNLIMASAFAMLFFALFSDNGPVNAALVGMGILKEPFSFLNSVWGNRGLIGLMNFLMWFGNTTIMLMAAIMGVDPTLYEAAELDGCTPNQMFWKITIPLIRPILVYVMITSMIGGLQMFDVPQILTNGKGGPDRTSTTMIMYLNNHLFSKNYGMAGAVSVVLFLVCAVLCVIVYMALTKEDDGLSKAERKARRQAAKQVKGGKA